MLLLTTFAVSAGAAGATPPPKGRRSVFPKEFYEKHAALVTREGKLQRERNAIDEKLSSGSLDLDTRERLEAEKLAIHEQIDAVRAAQKTLRGETARAADQASPPDQKLRDLQQARRDVADPAAEAHQQEGAEKEL
jgi:hypothetical protein